MPPFPPKQLQNISSKCQTIDIKILLLYQWYKFKIGQWKQLKASYCLNLCGLSSAFRHAIVGKGEASHSVFSAKPQQIYILDFSPCFLIITIRAWLAAIRQNCWSSYIAFMASDEEMAIKSRKWYFRGYFRLFFIFQISYFIILQNVKIRNKKNLVLSRHQNKFFFLKVQSYLKWWK